MPVTILRPSIITACYDDPFMGWIDSPAASGGITLGIEMGIMRMVHSTPDAIMDLIPCDYVTSNILVQTAVAAIRAKPILNVVHAATTTKNPVKVSVIREYLMEYVKYYPWYSQQRVPWAWPIGNKTAFRVGITLTEHLPLRLIEMYGRLSGNRSMEKGV